jgi:Transglutaminase-like superfamily
MVDLHQTLLGVTADADRFWEALAPHREQMRIAGANVDVLDPAGRAFVLALHSAKDGGRDEKPLRDLERALEILPLELWRSAAEIAAEVGGGEAFAAGLRRTLAGREVAASLEFSKRVTPQIALREGAAPPLSVGIDWLLHPGATSSKASLVLRKLVPPPEFMFDWSPLARRGPLGLALAYAWRPLWVLWRIGPALRAVLDARATAERSRAPRSPRVAPHLSRWAKAILVARIWSAFIRTRILERRLPLPDVTRRLAARGERGGIRVDPRRLGGIVGRVLRIGSWQPRCLFSALVLFRLLHEQGDAAELVIGLPIRSERKDAHAWVEVGGLDVGPPPGGRGRVPLARFR